MQSGLAHHIVLLDKLSPNNDSWEPNLGHIFRRQVQLDGTKKKTFSKVFYDLYLPYPNFIIFLPQVNINPAYQISEMEYTLRKVNRRFFYSQSIAEMSAASHLKFCTILILLHGLGILIWLLLDCEDVSMCRFIIYYILYISLYGGI